MERRKVVSPQCQRMLHECRGKLAVYTVARFKYMQARSEYLEIMKECATDSAVELIESRTPNPPDMAGEMRRVMGNLRDESGLCLRVTRLCHMLDQVTEDLKNSTRNLRKKTIKFREQCVFNSVKEFDDLVGVLHGRRRKKHAMPNKWGNRQIAVIIRAGAKQKREKRRKGRSGRKN